MPPVWIALAIGIGYLLGSIPFGLVLTRLAGLGDIRSVGSGNIGATNVLRTGNKPLAAAVLVLDSGKGAIAVLLAPLIVAMLSASGTDSAAAADARVLSAMAGVAAVVGHNFPVWLKFRGGKGVATTLGTLIALSWPVGLAACAIWLLVAVITRYSSLSALIAVALAPVTAYMLLPDTVARTIIVASLILAVLVWVRHSANIRRLMRGEEPNIGRKKDTGPTESDAAG